MVYLGTFEKLRFDFLEKSNCTDCKFICGVADEGIMKSARLEWGIVIMRHSSLLLDMKYIEDRVINCVIVVLIKCKNINIYFHNVQLQCFKAVSECAIEAMEICLHK